MKKNIKPLLLLSACTLLLSGAFRSAYAANTDGTVTYSVKTINYNGGYDPKHVVVVWVVDADGNFVKTLCRHAGSRINYLYKWRSDRGSYTDVDGVTSATINSQPQTHEVVWDCRDIDNNVVVDGTYYFRAEYTSSNAQGPYMQWACPFIKGTAPVDTTFPDYSNANGQFTEMSLTYAPDADIAVTAITPASGITDEIVPIQITVANQTGNPASFTVTANNLTPTSNLIGTQSITDLAGNSSTTVTVNWNTSGLTDGPYQIQAVLSTLAGETDTADNTFSRIITLSTPQMQDVAVTAVTPATGLTEALIPVTVTVANAMGNPAESIPVILRSLDGDVLAAVGDTIRVAADNDDAEERLTSSNSMYLDSSDLELVQDGSNNQEVGLRFQGVNIPQNATVRSAYLQFTAKDSGSENPVTLNIRGENTDDAAGFTTATADISGRTHTTANVNWSPPEWATGESGPGTRTPDLKNIVQEIVNRPGWSSGNSMVLMITGSGMRRAWSHDDNAGGAAQLILEWEALSSVVDTVIIDTLGAASSTNIIFNLNTTGLTPGSYRLEAVAGPIPNETNTGDNTLTSTIVLRDAIHNLAIHEIVVPPLIAPDVITNVMIIVTNRGDLAESATTSLSDTTASPSFIGSQLTGIPANSSATVTIPWDTTGASLGYHTLQAEVAAVTGETDLTDNSAAIELIIGSGISSNVLIASDSEWKYLDQGLDISGAPWIQPTYYDGFWATGPAPLGYDLANINTTISYGPDNNNHYPTTYFRREFYMDFEPSSVIARMMRTDGAVLYINGKEVARQNMPEGDIGYTTPAASIISRPDLMRYFDVPIAASNLVIGRNLISAELHLAAPTRLVAGFSFELITVNPAVPIVYALNPIELIPDGSAQPGDTLGVTVILTNDGNTTVPCMVLLKDAASGAVLASSMVPLLAPGETTSVRIDWPTFGASPGTRTVQAVTVCNGVTNLASIASTSITIEATDFAPRLVNAAGSIGGRCNAVAVAGRYVYLGCGSTLECWDALNPSEPIRLGAVRLPGIIEDIAAAGSWVYAAAGAAGVQIIEAADPGQMIHSATFDSSGHARRIRLDGNLLYIADVIGGIRILNVATPATPTLAGFIQTTGPAQAVTCLPPQLLIMDIQQGLQIYQAANPAAITLEGACRPVTSGLALEATAGTAWATDANNGLFRINTSAPAAPVIADSTLLPSSAHALAFTGSALYAATGPGGLLTLDATSLALQNTYDSGDEAMDVAISGNTLYVAAGFAGCKALNITNPMQPQPLGTFDTGARPVDAAAHGSMLFVAADEAGLQIHNLQNLALPALIGSLSSIDNARCVAAAYPLIYVADGLFGLKIFNVSNPEAPALIGSYAAPGLSHIRRLAISGNRAVLTDGSSIHLLNIETPSSPELLATDEPGGFVFDLTAISGEVYAACGGAGVKALRLDTLGTDTTYITPGSATGVSAISNLLHVACAPSGWQILNIDNPANPVLVHSSPTDTGFALAAAGPLLYLADGERTARVLNVSAPLTPVTTAAFPNLNRALRVRAVQGLMLSAEDEAGMAIFNANPGDINLNGIPDDWEQQIVNVSIATNGPVRSVLDVNSQDIGPNGFPYYQSYLAGLSPTDPNSVLAISSVLPQANGGQFAVQWYSVPGKRYTLYKSTNLAEGFTAIPGASGIVATGDLTSYTDTVSSASAFYMVVLTP